MKKLYSFRAEVRLLEALRDAADREGTTVSNLMHRILSKALGIREEENNYRSTLNQDLKRLKDSLKEELREELRREIIDSSEELNT